MCRLFVSVQKGGLDLLQAYETILAPADDAFVERKSRFIGRIAPVKTEAEALAFLADIRAKDREATHHVYAYILREGGVKRMSDDGEPQGTGGIPVLDVIQREGLVDVIAVVTRYFGGILLGTGGLVRAYSHGAKIAVDAAQRVQMNPCTVLKMDFDYSLYGKISYLLPKYNAQTLSSDFGAVVSLKIMLTSDKVAALQNELTELTAAVVVPRVLEECYAHLS